MTRIVRTAYRYKRPPRKKQPVPLPVEPVVTIREPKQTALALDHRRNALHAARQDGRGRNSMTSLLADKTCTPCRGGVPPLTVEEAEAYRVQAPEWVLRDEATRIERTYRFRNFSDAFAFVRGAGLDWHMVASPDGVLTGRRRGQGQRAAPAGRHPGRCQAPRPRSGRVVL
jgi:hypothetical protein